jgi:hypothetical protein
MCLLIQAPRLRPPVRTLRGAADYKLQLKTPIELSKVNELTDSCKTFEFMVFSAIAFHPNLKLFGKRTNVIR